jgi:olefin beta-lactone synthetase
VVVAVVVPAAGARRGLATAGTELADAVRAAAGVQVAAVLVTDRLPVDIRHQSKVDRREVARRAARLLAGARR